MKIVATSDLPSVAREAFAPLGEIVVDNGHDGAVLRSADVLIVRGGRVDMELLDRAPELRAIARTGAGYDNLDVDEATRRGVPIVYAPGVGSQPVAEGTVALMLAAAKRLGELGQVVQEGRWDSRYEVTGLDIQGAWVGIVGLGAIGRRVARLCRVLGMHVVAHDPAVDDSDDPAVELMPLEELVARSDVISLHCDLNAQTRGLVNRHLLAHVKRGAILVNVARGQIIESEDVLMEALVAGRLSSVALDVFPSEPPDPEHQLYSDPRVICTPHVIGLTPRWNEEVFRSLAEGVAGVLAGEMPDHVLNPEAMTSRGARPRRG